MTLATEIKEARAKLGLSQSQAAQAWGIPLGTLKGYEKNQRQPRGLAMTMLRQILDAAKGGKPAAPASSASPATETPSAAAPKPPAKEKRSRRKPLPAARKATRRARSAA